MEGELPAPVAAARDRAASVSRLVLTGLLLNLFLGLVKVGGGVWGHASALVADGTESIVDVVVSLIVWWGFQWAVQPPDEEHPYGHGKAESVAALLTAAVVAGTAAVIAFHAVVDIRSPGPTPHWATLVILAVGTGLKLAYSLRLGRLGRDTASTVLGAEAWHNLGDALTSVAAFVGISIAVMGGPRFAAADGWAALAAGAVIFLNGARIFRRAVNELMDTAVPNTLEGSVRAVARAVEGVESLHRCRIRKSGLTYLVDIQIRVDGGLTVTRGHAIAHHVKDALIASDLRVSDVIVHVEPEVPVADGVPGRK